VYFGVGVCTSNLCLLFAGSRCRDCITAIDRVGICGNIEASIYEAEVHAWTRACGDDPSVDWNIGRVVVRGPHMVEDVRTAPATAVLHGLYSVVSLSSHYTPDKANTYVPRDPISHGCLEQVPGADTSEQAPTKPKPNRIKTHDHRRIVAGDKKWRRPRR